MPHDQPRVLVLGVLVEHEHDYEHEHDQERIAISAEHS